MVGKIIKDLLIEDNQGDAELLRELLTEVKNTRFESIHTKRLDKGLECLLKDRFDLVLLDLFLPDSHGIETLKTMRAQTEEVPIVVLTSLDDESMAIQAVKEGAQDYIVKSQMDSNLLARSLFYAIERHQVIRELKKAIQKILEQQKLIIEEEKLKVLIQMAGATAHELNQPLTVILPRMELSLAQVDKHAPIFKEMTIIYQQCVRMADLVKKISEISIHQTKPYAGNTEIIDIEKASHYL